MQDFVSDISFVFSSCIIPLILINYFSALIGNVIGTSMISSALWTNHERASFH